MARNILGGELQPCSMDPLTGFFRDGCCNPGSGDVGVHTVCVVVSEDFLEFSRSRGNDLTTPQPQLGFSGLKAGDLWCLCAARWQEALEAGHAPDVVLESTHMASLEWVTMDNLCAHAVDQPR